jgi:multisubunit Na+/H+ antiporter MnhF subunit
MRRQDATQQERQDGTGLAVHIVGVAAALVGVCLTVIGLIQVWLHLRPGATPADNILAVDAVVFLLACFFAYASLRSRSRTRRRALERMADVSFLVALCIMTLVCGSLAFELM